MKKIKFIAFALAAVLFGGLTTSCVKDLEVTPIDPNLALPEDILDSQDAFTALLAKCYQGLAVSASDGPDSSPDIEGVDGGFGQYFRAIFYLNELTTDECVVSWNDGNIRDLHNLCWNSSNEYVLAMYYRVFYQISLCNEFIRRSNETQIEGYTLKDTYIAEARALRLLSYYHAIDMFGNVPFATEENSVGSTGPEQISRKDLFDWMELEANALLEGSDLAEIGKNEYGRCDKGLVMMILAKLYLNAEVYTGTAMYEEAAEVSESIIKAYPALHDNYNELFCADNHLQSVNTTYNGGEIIFAVPQDGITIQNYGATNSIIFGFTGDAWVSEIGISSGWKGFSCTGAFTSKFEANDKRNTFYNGEEYPQFMTEVSYDHGWKSKKFTNVNHDGSAAQNTGFVDTDYPVFRTADAYLMYAECAARGAADMTKGKQYLDAVRTRAGVGSIDLTLENIIDERARELHLEGFRRQDLIRFDMFTSDKYLWEFKGGAAEGTSVDSKFNLFPLTAGDTNANGNLKQNDGY